MTFKQYADRLLELHDEGKRYGFDTFFYATDGDMEVLTFRVDDLQELMSRIAYDKEMKLAMMKACLSEN